MIRLNINFGTVPVDTNQSIEPKKPTGNFIKPVPDNIPTTSPFGYRIHPILKVRRLHSGIDYGANIGTPVIASKDGCITFSGFMGGYGKTIEITHDSQYSTLYAHNSKLLAQVGKCVKQGDTVALSGNTGLSTAPHVHFEIKKNGMPVDPNLLLNK